MGSNTANLFTDFKSISLTEWETKLEKDLKGTPIEALHFKPEFDLQAKAYYHPDEFTNQQYSKGSQLNASNNDWAISQSFYDLESKDSNQSILKALNEGVTGLKITVSEHTNFSTLLSGVSIAHIFTHFVCPTYSSYEQLITYLSSEKQKVSLIEVPFLTEGLRAGTFKLDKGQISSFIQNSAVYCSKNIVIEGHSFCEFGASSAQELGIALSQLNAYLETLSKQNVATKRLHEKIAIHLGITDNYFVNVAKFRAIKELVLQLQLQWELPTDTMPWISAETVIRHLTVNDRFNNVLRQTTAATSAILGGISQLIIRPYSEASNNDEALSSRLAKNIQLILKEEAYLNQVIDTAAGSYVVESLTDQLIDKAWSYFMAIEAVGGYYKAIENGHIHQLIEQSKASQITALNENIKTLLGVNKYQNGTELWHNSVLKNTSKSIDFKGFSPFNLESNFDNAAI
ncbi:MAG: methylmalonyl-CoA mutase family protein [Putridiphycobacter sp.]|nr:methylmalonyl-CoA mutase family protein [Putridiphycobacter sp.]